MFIGGTLFWLIGIPLRGLYTGWIMAREEIDEEEIDEEEIDEEEIDEDDEEIDEDDEEENEWKS
jgi:hypothetical protein